MGLSKDSAVKEPRPVSIIIVNHNYGSFLEQAIDSALNQTYRRREVIVVDDGSTDRSPEIIVGYGDRIIPVLKANGGQGSASNAGFAVSHGEVVFFLDSDDMLVSTAVERVLPFFDEPGVVKVHWPLRKIDRDGKQNGELEPSHTLSEGDLREMVLLNGPGNHVNPPMSGNAWARAFLQKVFPVPEREFPICVDLYLEELAPLFGPIKRVLKPLGFYRVHGKNAYACCGFDEMLRREVTSYNRLLPFLAKHCRNIGLTPDLGGWERDAWPYRLAEAAREVAEIIPAGDIFILVDEDRWGMDASPTRRPVPFLEKKGKYWGRPPDDATAIREVKRLRRQGAKFMVFEWETFWWLDYFSQLNKYLRSNCPCILENERLRVFDLRRLP